MKSIGKLASAHFARCCLLAMPLVSSAQSIQSVALSSGVNPELQNPFPVDLSYLVWHHNVDGYIDATAVSLVKSRSSTKVNVPEGSILELFEPVSLAVPRSRLPLCIAGGLLPSMGDAVNATMARLEAAVNSHQVNDTINYAVEQTQAKEELSKLDITYANADSETKAFQRYAAATTMALSAIYTSDEVRIAVHPSGGVSRVCESTAGSQDWMEFQADAPARINVVIGRARFDQGGTQPTYFRRVQSTNTWVAPLIWPLEAESASIEIQDQGNQLWFALAGPLNPGRPSVSAQLKDARANFSKLIDRIHQDGILRSGANLLPAVPASNPAPATAIASATRGFETEAPAHAGTAPAVIPIPHNYALIFATDDYAHWPHLTNPISDADAVNQTLTSLYAFHVEEVRNATDDQILAKLTEYLHRKFEPQDQFLIFFSGHGYFDPDLGKGFLVPANALLVKDDIGHRSLLAHETIMGYVNRIPAKHVVLVLDACFAGTLDRRIADSGLRGDTSSDPYAHATLPELLARKEPKRTRRYITSGGKDFVPDGLPGHHSPFISAFLITLNEAADRKGYITLDDIQQGLNTVNPEPRWGDIQDDNDPGADFLLLTPSAIAQLSKVN